MNILWLLDDYILSKTNYYHLPITDVIKNNNYEYILSNIRNISYIENDNNIIIPYGSHQFINKIKSLNINKCFIFNDIDKISYPYISKLGNYLLNDDYIILPFCEIERRKNILFNGEFFIRPLFGNKLFNGTFISKNDLDIKIKKLKEQVNDNSLCIVSSKKDIIAEFRFIIINNKIITYCQYRYNEKLDIRNDVDASCLELMEKIISKNIDFGLAYVCDIALTKINEKLIPKVIEFNSFSCSGFYSCNINSIVSELSKTILNISVI